MVLSLLHAAGGWFGREHLHVAGNHLDAGAPDALSVGVLPLREAALDIHFGAFTHEVRNELVEELIIDYVSESHAEPDVESMRDGRTSGMESKKGRRRGEVSKSQEKRP